MAFSYVVALISFVKDKSVCTNVEMGMEMEADHVAICNSVPFNDTITHTATCTEQYLFL